MPRGKKARTEEREKKPKAVKGKKKSKDESKPAEEDKKKDHTLSEITAYLNDNKGNLEAINEFKELMLKSSLSKKLVNSTISTIFDIVEKNPTQLQWGKACIEAVTTEVLDPKNRIKEVHFFPNPDSEKALIKYLDKAQQSLLVCVFTFTNNDLADALRRAKARGVRVKIISDDDMMKMIGSDIQSLHNEGFEVRTDLDMRSHMHHKFTVIDDYILVTGSFNWTKQVNAMWSSYV